MKSVYRAWINQPSTKQEYHRLNGTNVLAVDEGDGYARAYFLSGPVISQRIARIALSPGWNTNKEEKVVQALKECIDAMNDFGTTTSDREWLAIVHSAKEALKEATS